MRRLTLLLALSLLTACGQSGDLYLPGEPGVQQPPPPPPGTSTSNPVITEPEKKKDED